MQRLIPLTAEITSKYEAGAELYDLGQQYYCSADAIRTCLQGAGVAIRGFKTKKPYSPAERARFIARYTAGASVEELAKEANLAASTMRGNLQRWGAEFRRSGPQRTHTLDERYFDVIDTEAKAYWLGFILADGNVNKTILACSIGLGLVDTDHLLKLAAAVNSSVPLASDNDGRLSVLTLHSAQLCRDLVRWGVIPAKTGRHGTPPIDPDLLRHLYRGFFDGNGSLFECKTAGDWRFELVGPPPFIADFQAWVIARTGLREKKLVERPPVASIRYAGGVCVEQVMDLLYEDATVYLDRKHAKLQDLKARHRRGHRYAHDAAPA